MPGFPEVTINLFMFAAIIFLFFVSGFVAARVKFDKQKAAISRLEVEMLRSHAEILQLQKELSEKEHPSSKTPIFSIRDSGTETTPDKTPAERSSKKISGGGKGNS